MDEAGELSQQQLQMQMLQQQRVQRVIARVEAGQAEPGSRFRSRSRQSQHEREIRDEIGDEKRRGCKERKED